MTLMLLLCSLQLATPSDLVTVDDWQRHVWIGRYDPAGFACYDQREEPRKEVMRLYFKTPLYQLDETRDRPLVQVRVGKTECFVAADAVSDLHNRPFACLKPGLRPPQALMSLPDLLTTERPKVEAGKTVGPFFPTFYQIADERLYPGKSLDNKVVDNDGKLLKRVSSEFRKALLRQGTGMLTDGRVVNVGQRHSSGRRFVVLPAGSFGTGTGGYQLRPYRSVALDFDFLCDRLGDTDLCQPGNVEQRDRKVSRKNRKALAGMLLYLPRLDGVVMDDKSVHDGFVCAVDTGGGIKEDRIDIFVGTDAAGNPYYPPCRSENAFLRAGIESLIPCDWHTWQKNDEGKYERAVRSEYRTVSPDKGLDVVAFPALRCVKRP